MPLILKWFVLGFSALTPVINPVGSALIFLGIVGDAPTEVFRRLARKIAISTVLFLLIIEVGGAALLAFGISLPVVQLAGGLVVAVMGWELLNDKGSSNGQNEGDNAASSARAKSEGSLEEKVFYPLTFPLTTGPGCIMVTLTLSAHAAQHGGLESILSHVGIALAIVMSGVLVLFSYAYAPKLTRKIAPQTVHGILRVIAFVLLCIGVQIASKGLEAMIRTFSK